MKGMTISELRDAFDVMITDLLGSLSKEDFRALQRLLRGMTEAEWREIRHAELDLYIDEFIRDFPIIRNPHLQDQTSRALVTLAAWQVCQHWYGMLSWICDTESELPPGSRPQALLAEAALSLLACERGPMLWPVELGSPFQDR